MKIIYECLMSRVFVPVPCDTECTKAIRSFPNDVLLIIGTKPEDLAENVEPTSTENNSGPCVP